MAFGLRINNADGFIQIDQDFSNFVVVATGSVTLTGNTPSTVTFTDYGATPLVFVRNASTTEYVAMGQVTNSSAIFVKPTTTGSLTIQYMIAVPAANAPAPSGTAWGLKVRTATGATAFDSRHTYPMVSSILVTPTPIGSANNIVMTYTPAITNPWMLMSLFNGVKGIVPTGGAGSPGVQLAVGIRNESSTTVRVAAVPIAAGPSNTNIFVGFPVTTAILRNP